MKLQPRVLTRGAAHGARVALVRPPRRLPLAAHQRVRRGQALRRDPREPAAVLLGLEHPGPLGAAHGAARAAGADPRSPRPARVALGRGRLESVGRRLRDGGDGRLPEDAVPSPPGAQGRVHPERTLVLQPPPQLLRGDHDVGRCLPRDGAHAPELRLAVLGDGESALRDAAAVPGIGDPSAREAGVGALGADQGLPGLQGNDQRASAHAQAQCERGGEGQDRLRARWVGNITAHLQEQRHKIDVRHE